MTSAGTGSTEERTTTFASIRAESGTTLLELTQASPVLLVFLRHFGCSFCRQAINDIAELRDELDLRGVRPVFVHLGTPERAKPFFDYYGIGDVERISDPESTIYQRPEFQLSRVHPFWSLLSPTVWVGGG